MSYPFVDETNNVYGRLRVLYKDDELDPDGRAKWVASALVEKPDHTWGTH